MLERLSLGTRSLGGRRFPELSHPYRNDFQRDRDRIIHSRAFRRLQGKTQVFAAGQADHYRNRLTHTIEVSQVARTVATTLRLNEEYTETLALAHDLGHPPFGHVGERELDRQMERFGASFDHNLQALRIVDLLEQRYPRFDGLNLTLEVREGIVKHSREVESNCEPELSEFMPGKRPPLEAQILDIADEIAYSSADLDDAFEANLVTLEDLRDAVPQAASLVERAETQFPGSPPRVRFWEVQRQLMNLLIDGLIRGTCEAVESSRVSTVEEVRELDFRLARQSPDTANLSGKLKALLAQQAYSSPPLIKSRAIAVERIRSLFQYLIDNPGQVSAGYRQHLADTPVHRVVCDYIAGMTDAYFVKVHAELVGP